MEELPVYAFNRYWSYKRPRESETGRLTADFSEVSVVRENADTLEIV